MLPANGHLEAEAIFDRTNGFLTGWSILILLVILTQLEGHECHSGSLISQGCQPLLPSLYKRADFTPVFQPIHTQAPSPKTTNMEWIAETVTKALSSADNSGDSALISPAQQATTFALIVSRQIVLYLCQAESSQQSMASRFSLIPIWPPKFRHGRKASL